MTDLRRLKRKVVSDLSGVPEDDPPGCAITTSLVLGKHSSTQVKRPRQEYPPSEPGVKRLPPELFLDILSYLSPGDLLSLRGVDKFYKQYFDSPESKVEWKAAERRVGLPECPPELSHQRYAALMFGKSCMKCSKFRSTKHFFISKIRLCKECFRENIKYGKDIVPLGTLHCGSMDDIYSLAPCVSLARRQRVLGWNSQFSYDQKLQPLERCVYYAPALKAVFDRYSSMPAGSERQAYLTARGEAILAEALDKWLVEWQVRQLGVVSSRREMLRREATRRLKSLGYSDVQLNNKDDEPGWKWDELIEKPRALTDRSWNVLLPQLRDTIFLRMMKSQALSAEKRRTELSRIMGEIADVHCCVTFQDVLQLPLAQQVMDHDGSTGPFTDVDLRTLKKEIKGISRSFEYQLLNYCALLLDCPDRRFNNKYRACDRPSAFFLFRQRSEHYHLQLKTYKEILQDIRDEFRVARTEGKTATWKLESRIYAPPTSLIDALCDSVQISVSSHDEMAAKGSRFKCLRCGNGLMTWVDLVRHFYEKNLYHYRKHGRVWSSDVATDKSNDHGADITVHGPLACDTTETPDQTTNGHAVSSIVSVTNRQTCIEAT
ncbi:hypothetical protein ACEPAH_8274 [Sanghuangporus vaninii]